MEHHIDCLVAKTVALKRTGLGKIENKFNLPEIGQVVPEIYAEMYALDDIPCIPVLKYTIMKNMNELVCMVVCDAWGRFGMQFSNENNDE